MDWLYNKQININMSTHDSHAYGQTHVYYTYKNVPMAKYMRDTMKHMHVVHVRENNH